MIRHFSKFISGKILLLDPKNGKIALKMGKINNNKIKFFQNLFLKILQNEKF